MDACPSFPHWVLPVILLLMGVTGGDQSLPWMLNEASVLLCGGHSPVGGRVCS